MKEELQNTSLTDKGLAAISVSHLLNPALHFTHPNDVLAAEHLDTDEKRAILASWASDQFAVESIPALRHYPGTESAVTYDEILQALKALDGRVVLSAQKTQPGYGGGNREHRRDLRVPWPIRRRSRVCART